jgi:hypothetical protein
MDDWKVNPSRPGLVVYVPPEGDGDKPPNKYTRELHTNLVERLRDGFTPDKVAPYYGLSTATFWKWVQRGRNGDRFLANFAQDVDAAMAEGMMRFEATVIKAGAEDADIALKVLERRDSTNYNREIKVKVESALVEFLEKLADHPRLPAKYYDVILEIAAEQISRQALSGAEEGEGDEES